MVKVPTSKTHVICQIIPRAGAQRDEARFGGTPAGTYTISVTGTSGSLMHKPRYS
jgi:hypothetical protein